MKHNASIVGRTRLTAADTNAVQVCRQTRRSNQRPTCAPLVIVTVLLLSLSAVSARQYPLQTASAFHQRLEPRQSFDNHANLTAIATHSRGLKQTSCPESDSASNTCKSVGESDIDSWRNVLVSQCSTVTPPSAGQGGCCSELPTPGTSAWTNFVSCACSTLASEVDAFVSVSNVISTCGSGSSGSGSSLGSFSGSPSSSPSSTSLSSPESFPSLGTNPFASGTSQPPPPPSTGGRPSSSASPSTVNVLPSPRPPGSPPSPLESYPLGSDSTGGGTLANLQYALNGAGSSGSSPSGSSGSGMSSTPMSTISGAGSTTPGNAANNDNDLTPTGVQSIG